MLEKRVVAPAHLVEIAGQVEGVHDFPARALGVIIDHPHHGFDTPVERTGRTVRLQFVILDEIDSCAAELIDQRSRFFRPEPDAGLDDGPDQRPALYAGKPARTLDAETRPRI